MLWLVASVCMEPQQCWHLLALVAYSLKPVKLLGSCKRTQLCWPTTPNIVGPNNVVTCCVRLHGTTTMLALVAYSLKPVKLLGPCKRTQHCWPTTRNNVGSCWHLLRPFAWAFSSVSNVLKRRSTRKSFQFWHSAKYLAAILDFKKGVAHYPWRHRSRAKLIN